MRRVSTPTRVSEPEKSETGIPEGDSPPWGVRATVRGDGQMHARAAWHGVSNPREVKWACMWFGACSQSIHRMREVGVCARQWPHGALEERAQNVLESRRHKPASL